MSALPGATTKQTRSAPALNMRSTRNSLTARGRSTSPTKLLPTGSSSLEKPRGWIRVPMPAAGMMPHMRVREGPLIWPPSARHIAEIEFRRHVLSRDRLLSPSGTYVVEHALQLACTVRRRVLGQHTLACGARNPAQLLVAGGQR